MSKILTLLRKLNKYINLLKDYAINIDKCVDNKKLYSKTNVDVELMKMKTDYTSIRLLYFLHIIGIYIFVLNNAYKVISIMENIN